MLIGTSLRTINAVISNGISDEWAEYTDFLYRSPPFASASPYFL